MGKRTVRTQEAIAAGSGPWEPWHFVGAYAIGENPVYPGYSSKAVEGAAPQIKAFVNNSVTAAVEATKAINRMMGRHELAGVQLPAHDDEA